MPKPQTLRVYNSEENKTTVIEYAASLQNNSSFICNSLSLAVLAGMEHQHMSNTHNNHLRVASEEHHSPYIHKNTGMNLQAYFPFLHAHISGI